MRNYRILPTVLVICLFSMCAVAQKSSGSTAAASAVAMSSKTFTEYKGVGLGVMAVDVRTKLGTPKEKGETLDFFIFSDNESAQIYYDATHKVSAVMVTFTGDVSKAPTAKDVFGEDVAPNAAGTIFKMERYPKAGYWISYTRTSGSDAMVNIAMQKM
ncbi:MAG TPA: hypothetical protein VGO43_05560 [Pyrinomonadaceae bacterium]|nr:hypothetical protein [Pyrinomonadaceae bacterium]